MLIQFSVENFRSLRERQTLSMVAAPKLKKEPNTFEVELDGEKLPRLLKAAAIYGPNASGKSNLVSALATLSRLLFREPSTQETPLPISPFRFDAKLHNAPSTFEIHFVADRQRYCYAVSATSQRIVSEKLLAFPRGAEHLLFSRERKADSEEYEFGALLEGGYDLHDTWRKTTAPDVLFLARAVANSSEQLTQLRKPFRWLTWSLHTILIEMSFWRKEAQRLTAKFESAGAEIAALLREVDVPITHIRTEERARMSLLAQGAPKSFRTVLTHSSALGEADFDLSEESDGTQNLIGFSVPWGWMRGDESRGPTNVLIVDEIDSSLHPNIVTALVARHLHSPTPKQLIFTTHDTHLMDAKLLRRDQFWLTERNENGATQLHSMHEYQGREGEDIEKRYYEGRYRGLPNLRSAS
jgi:AAA15 family ATPase/GTPase